MTSTSGVDQSLRPSPARGATWPVLLLVLVATALRLFRINDQLWIDEFSALDSIRRHAWSILTEWPGYSSHIFFELLASISLSVFGESPFSIRFPAAVLGVLGVWLTHRLVARLFESSTALVVSGLFAVSYHHVLFSQNARGYTTLMFFFLLSTLLLDVMRAEGRVRLSVGIGYGVSGALAVYSQPFGVFVVAGHVAVVAAAAAIARVRGAAFSFPLWGLMASAALAAALATLTYLPFLGDILSFARTSVADPGEGPRMGAGLLFEVVEGLQAAFFGPIGLAVASTIGLVGLSRWVRVQPLISASFVAPLVLEVVTFTAMGAGVHPRYFAIALPILFLVGGVGIVTVVAGLLERLPLRAGVIRKIRGAVLLVVVALSAAPLRDYYSIPKQDYVGAIQVLNESAGPGDIKAAVHLAYPVNAFYGAGFEEVLVLDDLLRLEARGSRVWLVTTLERLLEIQDTALLQYIRAQYSTVAVLRGSVGDGAMRIYRR